MSFRRTIGQRKTAIFFCFVLLLVTCRYNTQPKVASISHGDSSIVASSADVYYTGTYWNDYEKVQEHLNEKISGNIHIDWANQLIKWRKYKKFKKALILSCGNGWVERMLIEKGVIESAVGVDVNEDLLFQAKLIGNPASG